MVDSSALTILFLAANPLETSQSRLEQEARDISEGLLRAQHRDHFKFEQRWAVRPRDIRLALLECNSQIVHFAGQRKQNGVLESQRKMAPESSTFAEAKFKQEEEGLAFQDETGQVRLIPTNALADLFKLFSDQVKCVLLNGCYTEEQAKVIAQHISYVIGMKQSITDEAALEFALGFYDALGAGRSMEFAYNLGCTAIQIAGLPEHLTPVLYKKSESNSISTQNGSSALGTNLLDGATQTLPSKRRVQEKREDLEEEYEEIRKKLKWLKKEWTIKTDSEAKYELSQRIEQYEVQLQNIADLLEQLEKQ
ncbi:TIR domain-containing protein [Iningainema tapete]|uniref:TIR domain-containing protein n=1 Tax=Iningainema tapete BLCC-T55 TaxID=2748662 RepID=A0A8J6XNB3_9CYAN|nr:TIR domain-containing protein [Iningainema tapete]MBD2775075.1 TIR domain-containing protein [Iningainema tapete BLCC-T55]